ncbi:MAG: hypothetical protein HOP29_11895 [Phycisphaerales bacterium]|nr:hypothetical protein [Phycisphaerales bacterium]
MNVAILTSTDTRHRFFVNAIAGEFNVVAIGYQETGYHPARPNSDRIDERTAEIVRRHFDERVRQESIWFGHDAQSRCDGPESPGRALDIQSLNTSETVDWLNRAATDVVVVYGTSLIKPPLLDGYAKRMINLHLGLSPYYRGTATNFYPLVNDEPEYVGATVQRIDAGIDSGPIIHHARPDITADDMPHTVGCKAILAGIEIVKRALREFESGTLTGVPQWPVENPRLYLRRDYRPGHVVRLYELIDRGLFPRYAARQRLVAPRVHLIP